ncbi:MAG: TRAP transporter fused permease subunit [Gemmatimonadetes bacterium]|nr:TRAP transporter fused permease subunit [Gemmatimonadota bacterium]MBT6902799.1 TRAP transporter fused permease subunit [Gemmatimonadota bacterium]MBT7417793.1 TRAP transporter fused permease subunit [Gemmatimonadota bacterium]
MKDLTSSDRPDTPITIVSVLLSIFVLSEVNYPFLTPHSQLAVFGGLGLMLIFLGSDAGPHIRRTTALLTGLCFGFILIQNEALFSQLWIDQRSLGERAGQETTADYLIGLVILLLILEATRRTIGNTLPIIALTFIAYAAFGPYVPDWLFPHRGYGWDRIVSQTVLHSQGVFGIALRVMLTYVFLFVLFGAVLEKTGATDFIIAFAMRLFRSKRGAPAKVAVISSGLMGSLSGSAVANTATTGTFTIPLMRAAGFKREHAAGIEAAASSGGALVPPIMGAGAYMMLEIVDPPVTYLQIITAAIIPAILYYTSLLLIVHLQNTTATETPTAQSDIPLSKPAGFLCATAFASLILFLVVGFTPFRAVSLSLLLVLIQAALHPDTRIGTRDLVAICKRTASAGVSLIAAAACVGIIIGVVTLTGIGSRMPGVLVPLAQSNLPLALILLMVSTIILGMGLPSAVCYLLMATLVGPILDDLGLVPLAAHMFIFYFGMMSMVTPPVALAAYTASAIAGAGVMQSGLAAFRFALIGFALPYCFVLNPELLLLSPDGGELVLSAVFAAVACTLLGIVPLAGGVTGQLRGSLHLLLRLPLLLASGLLLFARNMPNTWVALIVGIALTAAIALIPSRWRKNV